MLCGGCVFTTLFFFMGGIFENKFFFVWGFHINGGNGVVRGCLFDLLGRFWFCCFCLFFFCFFVFFLSCFVSVSEDESKEER